MTVAAGHTRRPGLVARLRRDRRGATAVEFALIAPVMIAMYFGLAEYCQAMMADRKATHVASSLGDLVAQSSQVSASDMVDIFALGKTLMAPFPPGDLKMRVSNVVVSTVNNKPVAKVDWSENSGWSDRPKDEVVTLPASSTDPNKPFLAAGETAIMSEVQYSYDSPVDYFLKDKVVFNETFYLRPRKSSTVPCTGC